MTPDREAQFDRAARLAALTPNDWGRIARDCDIPWQTFQRWRKRKAFQRLVHQYRAEFETTFAIEVIRRRPRNWFGIWLDNGQIFTRRSLQGPLEPISWMEALEVAGLIDKIGRKPPQAAQRTAREERRRA